MDNIFNYNGLIVWSEEEIAYRQFLIDSLSRVIKKSLLNENVSWQFIQIESSTIIPKEFLHKNYTKEDCFFLQEEQFSLRPETTAGSYEYAKKLLNNQKILPPFCVWQYGKSYRNEQDNVSKNMRLKEFYQLEFQCIFSDTTLNDYHTKIIDPLLKEVELLLKLPTRSIDSDRLPSYSLKTKDIEVYTKDNKWMEIMSISLRNDFNAKVLLGKKEHNLLVLEIAIGLDRLIYNYFNL